MIIGLVADKGGVCKTTAAHNLGAELAAVEPPVLLVDADKQADLTELCGIRSEPNIGMDAILRQVPTPTGLGYVRRVCDGVDLIGTHPHMRKADRELAQRTRREYVLEEALREVLPEYRHVVIDVGHSEMVQLNVMAVAQALVIPTTPAKLDADHVANMLEEADLMRSDLRLPSLSKAGRVVVSVTRRSPTAGIEAGGLALIREQFARLMAPEVVPFSPRVIEASAMHMTLRSYREQHGGRRDRTLSNAVEAYAALAQHVLRLAPAMAGVA